MELVEPKPIVCLESRSASTLFYRDYGSGFSPQDFLPSIYNDGLAAAGRGGLLLQSLAFTRPTSSKMLNFYVDRFNLYGEETLFEAQMSARQTFAASGPPLPVEYIPRVHNMHGDYRLCCSSFLIKDLEDRLQMGFLFTNEIIYAYYARNAVVKGDTFFASAIPVKRRGMGPPGSVDNLDDLYRVGLRFNAHTGTLTWLVEGQAVLSHDRLGYRLLEQVLEGGGDDHLLKLDTVQMGFGHHSFLDHQRSGPGGYLLDTKTDPLSLIRRSHTGLAPCVFEGFKESYCELLPDTYGRLLPVLPSTAFAAPRPTQAHLLFGQGVKTLVREVSVTTSERIPVPLEIHPSSSRSLEGEEGLIPFETRTDFSSSL